MGWIKEANKLGEYHSTEFGYRIYKTEPMIITENGNETTYKQGKYLAIDKNGILMQDRPLEFIWAEIDKKRIEKAYGATFS